METQQAVKYVCDYFITYVANCYPYIEPITPTPSSPGSGLFLAGTFLGFTISLLVLGSILVIRTRRGRASFSVTTTEGTAMTRFGYNLIVAIWLIPMALIDFMMNTNTTGSESKYYLWAFLINSLLAAFALYQAFGRPATASVNTAQARQKAPDDEVVSFKNIGALEWVVCLVLILYGIGSAYWMYQTNSEATGWVSMASLLWFVLSIAVTVLSAVQFWHLKSGAIVELEHKMVG